MKKSKEFLCFVVAFVLLISTSITYFVVILSSKTSPVFSGTQYIRLLMADAFFVQAIFNTFLLPIFFSLITAGIFTTVVYFLRHRIKILRLVYYIGTALITSITVFLSFLYLKTGYFGIPTSSYSAITTISSQSPSVFHYISLWDVFLALYGGLFTTFLFWLAELIFNHIKKRAVKKNVTK